MRRSKHLVPYIRRHRRNDRTAQLRIAYKLANANMTNARGYVLVQHGSQLVMAYARSRRELIRQLMGPMQIALRRGGDWRQPASRDFRRWARRLGHLARGGSR